MFGSKTQSMAKKAVHFIISKTMIYNTRCTENSDKLKHTKRKQPPPKTTNQQCVYWAKKIRLDVLNADPQRNSTAYWKNKIKNTHHYCRLTEDGLRGFIARRTLEFARQHDIVL